MTLLQIKYALCCAQYLSINKAAEQLFTTASNISKSIKSLEQELGYQIFNRNTNGLALTPVGVKFIQIAMSIEADCERLRMLGNNGAGDSLSVCYNQVTSVKKAFLRYCSENIDFSQEMQLKLYQGNWNYCVEQLLKNNCQLAVLSFLHSTSSELISKIQKQGIEVQLLAKSNATLLIRDDHPIFDHCTPESLDCNGLLLYPYSNYVATDSSIEIITPHQVGGDKWPVNPSKIIDVNSMDQKIQLAKNTNAYTFIMSAVSEITHIDNMYLIPNPESQFLIYLAHNAKEPLDSTMNSFIKILQDALRNFDNTLD